MADLVFTFHERAYAKLRQLRDLERIRQFTDAVTHGFSNGSGSKGIGMKRLHGTGAPVFEARLDRDLRVLFRLGRTRNTTTGEESGAVFVLDVSDHDALDRGARRASRADLGDGRIRTLEDFLAIEQDSEAVDDETLFNWSVDAEGEDLAADGDRWFSFHTSHELQAWMEGQANLFLRLTDEQWRVTDPDIREHIFLFGGPGSGKTSVMLFRAYRRCVERRTALFVTWNDTLRNEARALFQHIPGAQAILDRVTFASPDALDELPLEAFDDIYLDEAQDLPNDRIEPILDHLRRDGQFFLAADPHQNVRDTSFRFEDARRLIRDRSYREIRQVRLDRNLRNTARIHRAARALYEAHPDARGDEFKKIDVKPSPVEGSPVGFRKLAGRRDKRTAQEALAGLLDQARRSCLDIAVLVADERARDQLCKTGISRLFVYTPEEAKGLEFEAVVLWDWPKLGGKPSRLLVQRTYVALTRARRHLAVLSPHADDWSGLIADATKFGPWRAEVLASEVIDPSGTWEAWRRRAERVLPPDDPLREELAGPPPEAVAGRSLDALIEEAVAAGDHARAGDFLLRAGRAEEAIDHLAKARAFPRLGQAYATLGRHREAAEAWEKAGEFSKAGEAWRKAREFEQAARAFRQDDNWAGVGRAWWDAGRFDAAGRAFMEAEAYDDAARAFERADDPKNQAHALRRARRHAEAAEAFMRAEDPLNAAREFQRAGEPKNQARALRAGGRNEEAARVLIEAGHSREAAEVYEQAGEFDKAGDAFMEAEAYVEAARAFERAGDRENQARALRAGGRNEEAARVLIEAGHHEAAAEALLEAECWEEAGEAFITAEVHDRAADAFRRAGNHARAGDALRALGRSEDAARAYEQAGSWVQAAEAHEEAGLLAPAAEARLRAGQELEAAGLLRRAGQHDRAAELFARADAPVEAGICLVMREDFDRARAAFEDAGRFDLAWATHCMRRSEFDTAAAVYIQGGAPDAAGLALGRLGLASAAEAVARRDWAAVASALREQGNPTLATVEGYALLHQGRWAEAWPRLRRAGEVRLARAIRDQDWNAVAARLAGSHHRDLARAARQQAGEG